MKYLNKYEVKCVLESRKVDFKWESFSKKELIRILQLTFMLYRDLDSKYNMMLCVDKYNN